MMNISVWCVANEMRWGEGREGDYNPVFVLHSPPTGTYVT